MDKLGVGEVTAYMKSGHTAANKVVELGAQLKSIKTEVNQDKLVRLMLQDAADGRARATPMFKESNLDKKRFGQSLRPVRMFGSG
jgi:hypothetical protein